MTLTSSIAYTLIPIPYAVQERASIINSVVKVRSGMRGPKVLFHSLSLCECYPIFSHVTWVIVFVAFLARVGTKLDN